MSALSNLQEERLDVLAGTRSQGDKTRQAVRVADLDQILKYSYRLKSQAVNAAPTMAQHNDLVDDVRRIHEILQALSKQLNMRVGRG